jgi:hypothetical protein
VLNRFGGCSPLEGPGRRNRLPAPPRKEHSLTVVALTEPRALANATPNSVTPQSITANLLSFLSELPKRLSRFLTHCGVGVGSRLLKVRDGAGQVANSYQRRA